MKTLVSKIGNLAHYFEQEKGEAFILFALVLPEDAIAWDLLAAANWIDTDKQAALRYIAGKVQSTLNVEELRDLSGIVLFETNDFDNAAGSIRSGKGKLENDIDFLGAKIQKGYLFAAPLSDFQIYSKYNSD